MDDIDLKHYNQSERYVVAIKKQYQALINEVSRLTALYDIDTKKPFNFDEYPALKKEVDVLLNDFAENTISIIEIGKQRQWEMGIKKVMQYLPFAHKNLLNYQESERNLSDRVWNLTNQYKGELEMALDLGIGSGKSANAIAREIKQYLNTPDNLFRRVRDKHGNLYLSKKAQQYHSGQGVYRSSYKNAQRLTRTETNIAYHTAIYNKYQEFDFIVGIEIRLSNNPNHCPFCATMTGKYPKDFKFTGWHPNCRCTTIPILAKNIDDVQEGEKVKDLPPAINDWLKEKKDKIQSTPKQPYFIRDNKRYVDRVLDKELYSEIRNLMKKAKESTGEISDLIKYLNKNFGGYTTPINLKSEASIYRKATQELNRNVFNIKDSIRATVVLPKNKYENILHNLENLRIFERIKVQTPERFSGYSGILVNIKTKNGIFAEIQFNTEKMIYAKERPQDAIRVIGEKRWREINKETGLEGGLGHKFYEEMRVLPKNSSKRLEIEKKSIEYYSKFR